MISTGSSPLFYLMATKMTISGLDSLDS
jgi:hypothetical protein